MPPKRPSPSDSDNSLPLGSLGFTVEAFKHPEQANTIVQSGQFTRNWDDEEELDVIIEQLEGGILSDKQALNRARKLESKTPLNLEIQNFIAVRLWEQNLRAEACDVYAKTFKYAASLIPAGFKGEISWGHLDNRSFLRLAHGYLLALMHRGDGKAASTLAKQLLNWCPMDNLGVRFLMGDIALMNGDFKGALKEYLNGADSSPGSWYQAGLIAFRQEKYVDACTYLRKGIAANPYIAEGLTGRTILREHNYWHSSGVEGASWAVDYLESPSFDWGPDEIDFVDWVFNSSHVLQERADLMRLRESMTCEHDGSARVAIGREMMRFRNGIDSSISKKMVRQTRNRDGAMVWPWQIH